MPEGSRSSKSNRNLRKRRGRLESKDSLRHTKRSIRRRKTRRLRMRDLLRSSRKSGFRDNT